ncbi:MAG: KaiC domain-containing protein [Zestosphaera sp.]
MIDRVETGVPGLDGLLFGGIPKRNIVLISGGPGTGKTIFSHQFLYHGLTCGEPGVLIALEEHPAQVRREMNEFGWDVRKYEDSGLFAIVDAFTGGVGESAKRERYVVKSIDDIGEFVEVVRQALREIKAQRAAVDSVSTLYLTKPSIARGVLMQLKKVLSGLGVTSFLVSQVSVTDRGFGGPGVEHVADGIIRLDLDEMDGELVRSIVIWKMRGTRHDMRRHLFEITDRGVVVYLDRVVRWRGVTSACPS